MGKFIKLHIAIMVLLILLTNIGYEVSISYCKTTKESKCLCEKKCNEKSECNKVPCCERKNLHIVNPADFLSNQNKETFTHNYNTTLVYYKNTNLNPSEYIIFNRSINLIKPIIDIPVSESKLLI